MITQINYKLYILLLILILQSCTSLQLALIPEEIEHYCRRVSGAGDKINQTMKTCIQYELDAKKELSGMIIPHKAEKYCRDLSESTGGSYQVMVTCVQNEVRRDLGE